MNTEEVIKKIREEILKYFKNYNLKYAIFGKSEGVDSSVVAGLLAGIPEIKPIGVIIPIESNPKVEKIAKQVLDFYNIPIVKIDLTDEYLALKNKLESIVKNNNKYAYGNIKARLRMITLYHIAKLYGGIVVSTSNFSEYMTGFWTLNGDVGDIAPIQQIFKGKELYEIAKALKVPDESLNAVPSDGLGITISDKDQLYFDYPELDDNIINYIKSGTCDEKVSNIIKKTEYKRQWPKVIKREEIGLKGKI